MQLDLNREIRSVPAVALTPIVADRVRKDVSRAREGGSRDAAADLRVAFEAVLSVLVPEVEGPVATGGAEGAVDGVERDCVDTVDFGDITLVRVRLAVALEREVEAGSVGLAKGVCRIGGTGVKAYLVSFSSTYWIAQRPSTDPTAKPVASLKQDTTRVCHFNGLVIVL
jgi:hypothetical protein